MGFRRRIGREALKSRAKHIVRGLSPEQLAALPSMSDTLAAFGGAFLTVPPGENRGKMLENILKIVAVAWNLPVTEEHNPEQGTALRKTYDHLLQGMPAVARTALERLVERRTTHFSHDPRTAYAEVAERDGEFYIKATGRIVPATVKKGLRPAR
jgi:hypothetical protein